MEKTIQDYERREKHLVKYCENMVKKFDYILLQYDNDEIAQIKRKVYLDVLFKLNYSAEKTKKQKL